MPGHYNPNNNYKPKYHNHIPKIPAREKDNDYVYLKKIRESLSKASKLDNMANTGILEIRGTFSLKFIKYKTFLQKIKKHETK